jgi:hypothetical protein
MKQFIYIFVWLAGMAACINIIKNNISTSLVNKEKTANYKKVRE